MFAATDWSNLTIAGAFVAGALAGSVAVIRITRHILEYLRREQRDQQP